MKQPYFLLAALIILLSACGPADSTQSPVAPNSTEQPADVPTVTPALPAATYVPPTSTPVPPSLTPAPPTATLGITPTEQAMSGCVVTTRFGAELQDKPSMLYGVPLAELPSDQQFPAIERSDEFPVWFRIRYGEITGWVSSQFLIVSPGCAENTANDANLPGVPLQDCVVTTRFGASLHDNPDMIGSVVLADLPGDQQYQATRRSDAFPTWFYLVHDGVGGWVSSQFLIVTPGCTA